MSEEKKQGPAAGNGREAARIGVYTCQCGGNIGDVVDCDEVAATLGTLPGVVVSRHDLSLCSDAGQAQIEEDIRELGVNRVVIGACAPALHEKTFRGTVARAGLNPYLYHHVGLREQDSWVHHDDAAGATQKAIRLMTAGIAKARLLEPLAAIRLSAEQHALVIGGGVAGLRAAQSIAQRGIAVTLIEKSPFLGGRMAQLEAVFPHGGQARTALHALIDAVVAHPRITIHTGAELEQVSGYVGDYHVTIRKRPRGISPSWPGADAAMALCPEVVPDPFNYGLTTRTAIYRPYPEAYPPTPAIDWEHCTRCGACLAADGDGISLDDTPTHLELTVGAVVVATGFRPYEPPVGEYGYGQFAEVITLPQLIRLLALHDADGGELRWQGRQVRNVAFIHCVGSRQLESIHQPQPDGQVNDYCSRTCCTATLHMANELRARFPQMHLFDIYEDIRTYGRGHEQQYISAGEGMVRFLRFHDDDPPTVVAAPPQTDHPLLVQIKDYLTGGLEVEVPADLVVLAVGMMPNPIEEIIRLLKIAPGTDRFLLEVHPKLRPVETAVPGVVLAGTAQGPMTIKESCAAAAAAAAKVAVLLGQGQVELEPFVARVDPARCEGSGQCVEVCCYEDAIHMETVSDNGQTARMAVVSPANCAGCGVCVSACPHGAIDLQGWTLAQYDAMVEAIVAEDLVEAEAIA